MSELLQSGGYRPLSSGILNTPEGVEQINSMFRILFQNFPGDMESRQIYYGVGSPESAVTASTGAMYFRTDASSGAALYIKESGTGNTGWQVVDTASQTIPLSRGGTGASLSDPNADRIVFWDDSEGTIAWLTVGSNLTLSGTTLSADDQKAIAATTLFMHQEVTDQDLSAATWSTTNTSYTQKVSFRIYRTADMDTVTWAARMWTNDNAYTGYCQVTIGTSSSEANTTSNHSTRQWISNTIDISGESTGYLDCKVEIKVTSGGTANMSYVDGHITG